MKAVTIGATICLYTLLLTACTLIPQRFEPATAEEHAIASTVLSFLAAYRAEDVARLQQLSAPDAMLTAGDGKTRPWREGLVALRREDTTAALLQVKPQGLVNFQRTSAERASVESYVHNSTTRGQENSQFRWQLAPFGDQWLLVGMSVNTWNVNLHSQGGGP